MQSVVCFSKAVWAQELQQENSQICYGRFLQAEVWL